MLPGNYDHVTGVFSVSAYISQTSTRTMLSMRVSHTLLRPVLVHCSTTLSDAVEVTAEVNDNPPPSQKLEFLIHLFCLRQWEHCHSSRNDKEAFAGKVIKLYEPLHAEKVIQGPGVFNPPVSIQDAPLKREVVCGLKQPKVR
ncbi:hypothetical protein INT47_004038 [Mucor saturninus]|uniref:Uncharacterized protein n=1 Tax=Mucor saturninus TaxID=64648 RepID=A0A8H7QE14_9FUNG|nr:hypothetical protein INT47_004038 [Mucor saturninus]